MAMRRIIFVIMFSACLALGQSQNSPLVSSAFGNRITLHERDIAGTLVFTLTNGMPSAVKQYVIETWGTYEHGPVRRFCSIDVDNADIAPQSTVVLTNLCTLTADPARGQPLSHSSRIVAIQLANGWKWHIPTVYKVSSEGEKGKIVPKSMTDNCSWPDSYR